MKISDNIKGCYTTGNKGFTMMEMVIVLAIIGILGSLGFKAFDNVLTNIKFESTVKEMKNLKKAIVGDPHAIQNDIRASFGYFGDMGSLPSTLNDLVIKGSKPLMTVNTTLDKASGWNGPYLESSFVQDTDGNITDGFGNSYIYSTAKTVSADGDSVYATITSNGADGSTGGAGVNADINVEIFKSDLYGSVYGNIYDVNDFGMDNAILTLYYADGSGGITNSSVMTANDGFYFFARIPFGLNSARIAPSGGIETHAHRVVVRSPVNPQPNIFGVGTLYLTGTATATGPGNQIVDFNIRNELGSSINLIDFRATYTHGSLTPTYDELRLDGNPIWTAGATRAGSGSQLASVAGGAWTNSTLNNNTTYAFTLRDFQDGGNDDMSGVSFTVRLYLATGQTYDFTFTP